MAKNSTRTKLLYHKHQLFAHFDVLFEDLKAMAEYAEGSTSYLNDALVGLTYALQIQRDAMDRILDGV